MTSAIPSPEAQPATRDESFSHVFTSALRGHPCHVVGLDEQPQHLPVTNWLREPDADDEALLALCEGPTIDIGCGPGRLTAALTRRGVHAVGTDISTEAVRQTRARGATAIRRDVFDSLPGTRTWRHVLLADGDIGIGGDPVALLRRVAQLLHPHGTAHVELSPTDVSRVHTGVRLRVAGRDTAPFAWAAVGPSAISDLAAAAGLHLVRLDRDAGRTVASLRPLARH